MLATVDRCGVAEVLMIQGGEAVKTKKQKTPDEIKCIVRPLPPSKWFPQGEVGLVRFNQDSYLLLYIADLKDGNLTVRGYRLIKDTPAGDGETYDLETNLRHCHCKGALRWSSTGNPCRHVRMLMHCVDERGIL